MLKFEERQLPQTQNNVRWLYQKYGALLLGYLTGIVHDQKKSEAFLVLIFSRFVVDCKEELSSGQVTWVKLLCYSRNLLPQLTAKADYSLLKDAEIQLAPTHDHAKLKMLTVMEKEIFCEIYYQGRSINDLANSLQLSEEVIRSHFKLSFDKIRRASGN